MQREGNQKNKKGEGLQFFGGERLDYIHRILIGVFGSIGVEFGLQSQNAANRIARQIGIQIGKELKERNLINEGMEADKIIEIMAKELNLADSVQKLTTPTGFILESSTCNICPKKVGKYALPATACPIPGLINGVLAAVGKGSEKLMPELTPGVKCRIAVKQ